MKVRVSAVIMEEDNILLVEHRRRGRAYWTLPGGRLEEDETIEECLRREITEETGLEVHPRRLLFVADVIPTNGSNAEHVVNLVFHAVVVGGQLATERSAHPGERKDHAEFVPLGSVPALGLYPPLVEEIAGAFLEDFHGETKYLGNLWREVAAAERAGGAPAER
jgi:ADP-ribose pyrophosphatase YjhB (NUDIX family)